MCFYSNLAIRGVHLACSHFPYSNVFREELVACLLFNPTLLLFHHLLPHIRIFLSVGSSVICLALGHPPPFGSRMKGRKGEKRYICVTDEKPEVHDGQQPKFLPNTTFQFNTMVNDFHKNHIKGPISYHQCSSLLSLMIQKLNRL